MNILRTRLKLLKIKLILFMAFEPLWDHAKRVYTSDFPLIFHPPYADFTPVFLGFPSGVAP